MYCNAIIASSLLLLLLLLFLLLPLLLGRFVFNTPYTPSGKARGDLHEQYMRKTILTTKKPFPYIKRRLKVIESDKVGRQPVS